MSILSAWRARCDRNAELRDERNDLIRAVNDAYCALVAGDGGSAVAHLGLAQSRLDALKAAATSLRHRDEQR